jgi:hypothetical protein
MKNSLNKIFCFFVLLISPLMLFCQSFQYINNGGGNNTLDSSNKEEIIDIVTDSQRNSYVISRISKDGVTLNGLPIMPHELNSVRNDIVLVSYNCDGTYRWHKVFGGGGNDYLSGVEVDSQDNVYVVGSFSQCSNPGPSNPYYSISSISDNNGFYFTADPSNTLQNYCQLTFRAKFNNTGILQWFHYIHSPRDLYALGSAVFIRNTYMVNDILYCLAIIPPGSYESDSFSNTNNSLPFLHYLLKYDTSGNFISATPFDLELSNYTSAELRWYRNPYNGYYYALYLNNSSNNITVTAGGNNLDYTLPKIICFNEFGQYQWHRETTGYATLNTMTFDNQNNIYVGGYPGSQILPGSFNGYSYTAGFDGNYFIMKCNSNITSYDWVTRYTTPGNIGGYGQISSAILHYDSYNDKIIFGGQILLNTTWGSQTISGPGANNSSDPLLARFDPSNGSCLGMHRILGTNGYQDAFTSIEQDIAGDLIVGGYMGLDLTDSYGNTSFTSGGNSDFFVTKFASQVCQPLSNESFDTNSIEIYPNPTKNIINIINLTENCEYTIFNIMGSEVLSGNVSQDSNSIDLSELQSGYYILNLINSNGLNKTLKVIKE